MKHRAGSVDKMNKRLREAPLSSSDETTNLNILLVEDDDDTSALLSTQLRRSTEIEATVSVAATLAEALDVLTSQQIDIILLDINLPDSEGIDTVQKVFSEHPKTPILVLTACGERDLGIRSVRSGAQDFLVKGQIPVGSLVRAIRYAVERSQLLEVVRHHQQLVEQSSKMASLGEMAAGIAHEINNPVGIIVGCVEILKPQLQGASEQVVRSLDRLDRTAMRISNIVKALKTYSRNDSKDPFELKSVQSIVDEAKELTMLRAKKAGCELKIDNVDEGLQVQCRQAAIIQVFVNLIGNALDAIEGQEKKEIEVGVAVQKDLIEIRVFDSGPGVPEDILSKIMNPFFTTKERNRGTGLGLSVSKMIVEAHGGVLEYLPEAERSCFVVKLPIAKGSLEDQAA